MLRFKVPVHVELAVNAGANHTQIQTIVNIPQSERDHLREAIHLPLVTSVLANLISEIGDKFLRFCFKLGEISNHRGRTIPPGGNNSIR